MTKQSQVPVNPGMDARQTEHADHVRLNPDNLARTGSVPKRSSQPVPAAHGMINHTGDRSMFLIGVTETSVRNAPVADAPSPMDPTVTKKYPPALPVTGHRSRQGEVTPGAPGEFHAKNSGKLDHIDLGQLIIGEAVAGAPPDHPARLGRVS